MYSSHDTDGVSHDTDVNIVPDVKESIIVTWMHLMWSV